MEYGDMKHQGEVEKPKNYYQRQGVDARVNVRFRRNGKYMESPTKKKLNNIGLEETLIIILKCCVFFL